MVVLALVNTMWASIGGLDDFFDAMGWDRPSSFGREDGDASTLGPSSHGTGGGGSSHGVHIGSSAVGDASRVGAAPAGGVTRRDIRRYARSVKKQRHRKSRV